MVTVFLVIFILGFAWFTGGILRSPLWGILGGLLLFASLWSYFLPVFYRISQTEIKINRTLYQRTYPWQRFRSFKVFKNGIYLSPQVKVQRFDRFRGVFLLLEENDKADLAKILPDLINAGN